MNRAGWIVTAVILLLAAIPARAFWGANGHRAVGLIAERHLSKKALQALTELMGTESLARASTWPDEIRSDSRWDFASPWHYINLEDGESLQSVARNPDGDILQALGCFEQVIRDPQALQPDQLVAVRYLVHLVGDLHQPLHVGRGSDRGGNNVSVQFFNEVGNLHRLWDSGLLDHEGLSYTEFAGFIDHAGPSQVKKLQTGSYRDWAEESLQLRGQAYDFGRGNRNRNLPRLGYDYAFENLPTVRRRIMEAGVRLAGVFNSIFDPDSAGPSDWSHPGDKAAPQLQCAGLGSRLGTD